MKLAFAFLFSLTTFSVLGQKINYLNEHFTQVTFKEQATYYTETTQDGPSAGTVKTYLLDGTIVSEDNFSNLRTQKREGLTRNYYPTGKLKTEITFKNGVFDGPLRTFYPNQRLKRAELYEKGNFVQGKCFSRAGYDTTYYAFQIPPQFKGGDAALKKYLEVYSRIPTTPITYMHIKQGFNDYVMLRFVVSAEGKITDVMIRRPLSDKYDREAVRLINMMPAWEPALQDGEPVPMEHTIAIGFKPETRRNF